MESNGSVARGYPSMSGVQSWMTITLQICTSLPCSCMPPSGHCTQWREINVLLILIKSNKNITFLQNTIQQLFIHGCYSMYMLSSTYYCFLKQDTIFLASSFRWGRKMSASCIGALLPAHKGNRMAVVEFHVYLYSLFFALYARWMCEYNSLTGLYSVERL